MPLYVSIRTPSKVTCKTANHHFRLSCIHLLSFVKKASSPFKTTRLPSCSIVGHQHTATWKSRPLLASLETTSMTAEHSSGLGTDTLMQTNLHFKLSLSPASVLTAVQASVYNVIIVWMRLIHTQLPLTTSLGTLIYT